MGTEPLCGYCGKSFYMGFTVNGWAYKNSQRGVMVYYCTYSCLRKADAIKVVRPKQPPKKRIRKKRG